MELIKADSISANTLEVGDLIGYENDIVEITNVESDTDGDYYFVEITNDFGEQEVLQLEYHELVDLFIIVE
jgi:hypothetical protein